MVPGDKNVLAIPAAPSCFLTNVIFINETISYTALPFARFSVSFHFFPSLFLSSFFPFLFFLLILPFRFRKEWPRRCDRTAGGTSQLRESFLHVITRNLERSVFSFDTCTDMLQIFSDYFTTLRNLVSCTFMQNLSSSLFFFSFSSYLSAQRSAPFFFLLLIGATKRTFPLTLGRPWRIYQDIILKNNVKKCWSLFLHRLREKKLLELKILPLYNLRLGQEWSIIDSVRIKKAWGLKNMGIWFLRYEGW